MYESHTFLNREGLKLCAELDIPKDPLSEPLGVVMVHGLRNHKRSQTLLKVAQHLSSLHKFYCLRFDLMGNGESEGEWDYSPYSYHAENDVPAAVEFMVSQGIQVLAVVGHSMGGNIVWTYLSMYYGSVPGMINVSGRYKLSRGVSRHFTKEQLEEVEEKGQIEWKPHPLTGKRLIVTKKAMDRRKNSKMEDVVDQLISKALKLEQLETKILTIHGTSDDIIPVEDAHEYDEQLSKVAGLHTLNVIEGADHMYYDDRDSMELCKHVAAFLQTLVK